MMRISECRVPVVALAVACTLALAGCSAAGNSSDGDGTDLEGTWLVTHTEPIQYDPENAENTTDAQVFSFSGSGVELIFYLDTQQVMGQRGIYTVSDDTLTMTLDEWWNPITPDWEGDDDAISLSFSLTGNTLSISPPGGGEAVALAQESFSVRPELAKPWYGTGDMNGFTLELNNTGQYVYSQGDAAPQTGTWDASEEYIRATEVTDGTCMGSLSGYDLPDGGSTLIIYIDGGGEQTYSATPPVAQ